MGNYEPTDWKGVESLWLLAYDDEQRARRAKSQAMNALVETRTAEAAAARQQRR